MLRGAPPSRQLHFDTFLQKHITFLDELYFVILAYSYAPFKQVVVVTIIVNKSIFFVCLSNDLLQHLNKVVQTVLQLMFLFFFYYSL